MYKKDKKTGRFVSTKSNKKVDSVRFFGPITSLVWNDDGIQDDDHLIITNSDITEAYLYYPKNEKQFKFDFYGVYDLKSLAESCNKMSDFWLEKDFNEVESIFLQDYSVLVPRTWEEVQKIVAEQERLENYKATVKEIKKQDTKEKLVEKLTLDDIKVGSLYYNLVYRVVERVIDIQGRLIYTSYHKMECNPFSINSFRKATQEEVDNYLKESEEIKG